jgi:hypothetical protein
MKCVHGAVTVKAQNNRSGISNSLSAALPRRYFTPVRQRVNSNRRYILRRKKI